MIVKDMKVRNGFLERCTVIITALQAFYVVPSFYFDELTLIVLRLVPFRAKFSVANFRFG